MKSVHLGMGKEHAKEILGDLYFCSKIKGKIHAWKWKHVQLLKLSRHTLIGLVNRGIDLNPHLRCENKVHPSIFARVGGPYRDWIKRQTLGSAVHDSNCNLI